MGLRGLALGALKRGDDGLPRWPMPKGDDGQRQCPVGRGTAHRLRLKQGHLEGGGAKSEGLGA